ncbi:hypothetical protein VULLAG_LOCUS1155 [Vulpes lagopus]
MKTKRTHKVTVFFSGVFPTCYPRESNQLLNLGIKNSSVDLKNERSVICIRKPRNIKTICLHMIWNGEEIIKYS